MSVIIRIHVGYNFLSYFLLQEGVVWIFFKYV